MAVLSGITHDASGAVLPAATVNVFSSTNNSFVTSGTSNGSGVYSITTPTTGPFFVVTFKAGSTFVAGVSRRDLVAV